MALISRTTRRPSAASERNERRLIAAAAAATLLGIVLSLGQGGGIGAWLTLIGLLLLIVALHRLGRLGPDAPRIGTAPPAPRPRKKSRRRARTPPAGDG